MPKLKLTNRSVDDIKAPETGQVLMWDTQQPGLGIRVTANGARSWVLQMHTGPHAGARRTLGKAARFSVDEARREAARLAAELAGGYDRLNAVRAERVSDGVTVRVIFEQYIKARALAPRSLYDYRRFIEGEAYLADWLDRPLIDITKAEIAERHEKLGEASPSQANYAMRVLRALFEFAIAKHEDDHTGESLFPFNPIKRALGKRKQRQWFRVGRKQTMVRPDQLPAWYREVMALESDANNGTPDITRDWLLIMMFTGLRRGTASKIEVDDVDFKSRLLWMPAANMKGRRGFALPLTDYHLEIFKRRKAAAGDSRFMFPGFGPEGFINDPRKQIVKIRKASGVQFSPHDLRRTFTTVAEGLNLSEYALKRLLHHAVDESDTTAGYIVHVAERLREPMQQVADQLLEYAEVKRPKPRKVVPLRRA